VDENFRVDQAAGVVISKDGKSVSHTTEHATGMTDNPMSDDEILAKFQDNVEPVLGAEKAQKIRDMVWGLDGVSDVGELVKLCA
jgi:2-methylcitrate dehydratase PrpD